MALHLPLSPRPASSWKPSWLGPTGLLSHVWAGRSLCGSLGCCCLLDVQGSLPPGRHTQLFRGVDDTAHVSFPHGV